MYEYTRNCLVLEQEVEPRSKRHRLNGMDVALHCHHYTTLYTQLAIDAKATELLRDVAEDTFFEMFDQYFEDNEPDSLEEAVEIIEEYYSALGLGVLKIEYLGSDSGLVTVPVSHVDAGWLKRWGRYDRPVNYLTAGYIAAAFAWVNDQAERSYQVTEGESLVMGASVSKFSVVRK